MRSKQTLFLHLTTTFVHKITRNKVCIAVPCFLGLGWPGNPSPAEAPVPNLRAPVVSFQLLGLPAGAVVRNKQQLVWFPSQVHKLAPSFIFSVLFQQVAVDEDGKKCWGILQIVFHPTLKTTSKAPAHQNSAFGAGKWSSKLYSMSPLLWDLKVIVAGTSKFIFWNYSNLKLAWRISECTLLKLLQHNIRWHGPITQAHSITYCRTPCNTQSVPYSKLYFP